MKTKFLFLLLMLFATSMISFAQNGQLQITSNKVSYERKGEEIPEYKKTFEVNYPKVSGIKDTKVLKNLENSIDYWKVFEITLEESLGDYYWLDNFDYNVNYNKGTILDIALMMEGSGAYPDGTVKNLVIDLNTGKKVSINQAFTNIGQLLVKIDKAQKDEIKKNADELKKESPEDAEIFKEYIGSYKLSVDTLEEFSVNDEGVTFIIDYGFPHAVQALQPEGRYFFKWAEIKPFINRDGLLGQLVR